MNQTSRYLILAGGVAISFFAQLPPGATRKGKTSFKAESTSSVAMASKGADRALELTNVAYEVTGDVVSGRPRGERLLLRQTVSSKQVLGEVGQEATTTLEAWPLGTDPKQKPLYAVKASGSGGRIVDSTVFVADRGLADTDWWSVYRLGTGEHLFDTYVPLVSFSISKDSESKEMEPRYIGLEVPPDGALKAANLVGVVTYASAEQVKSEILVTCDDPGQALQLRSYADTSRVMSVNEETAPRALRIVFRPQERASVTIDIPITHDDLDLAHAQLPGGLHLAASKREVAHR